MKTTAVEKGLQFEKAVDRLSVIVGTRQNWRKR